MLPENINFYKFKYYIEDGTDFKKDEKEENHIEDIIFFIERSLPPKLDEFLKTNTAKKNFKIACCQIFSKYLRLFFNSINHKIVYIFLDFHSKDDRDYFIITPYLYAIRRSDEYPIFFVGREIIMKNAKLDNAHSCLVELEKFSPKSLSLEELNHLQDISEKIKDVDLNIMNPKTTGDEEQDEKIWDTIITENPEIIELYEDGQHFISTEEESSIFTYTAYGKNGIEDILKEKLELEPEHIFKDYFKLRLLNIVPTQDEIKTRQKEEEETEQEDSSETEE